MSHEHAHPSSDNTRLKHDPEPAICPARRAMLGCALALSAAQFFGKSSAEAATTGKWTSAGAITGFATGKPQLVKLVSGRAPVFITKLSATRWLCLYAVCTHESVALKLTPGHPNYAFRCPRHGAKFAKDGKVLANQRAKRVLLKLPTKVVQDKLMVNVAGFV
jgi:nitrite reductase/ring-hydroxylating ferredoxin subunit